MTIITKSIIKIISIIFTIYLTIKYILSKVILLLISKFELKLT